MEGRVWEERSKESLKLLINKRIKSIIGVSLQAVEDSFGRSNDYENVRYLIMKVCNDISRKLSDDVDRNYTVKRNAIRYDIPFKGS